MSKPIVASKSPLTGATAFVASENGCSYLYLQQADQKAFHACWIKNHVQVKISYSSTSDMKKGRQPKIPTQFCRYKNDLDYLKEDQLEIVWGKDGSIVSLFEKGELICIIPNHAGRDFAGYSKYSDSSEMPGMVPFPIGDPESNVLVKRMNEAKEFWEQDFNHVWNDYVESYLPELEGRYGKHLRYFAIDGGNFPRKALVTFEKDQIQYAFTIGVGLFPQPKVDMHFEDYQDHELFELGFCYQSKGVFDQVGAQISSIAAIPWGCDTFLDSHHTVDLKINPQYNHAVLVNDKGVKILQSEFLSERKINLLWLVPVDKETFGKLTASPPDNSDINTREANCDIMYKG